ncbi:chorismate mutase [Thermopolyspora flexuosa]|jgi:isochorismate pyruvate lyase|uniref:Chorismate mutase n=1 Tax=Thermopolyspora flexuosa TaxID=103836 RepID=A0A543J1I4_9ACTN|nr:chorismate mutase [Thermopolyspora flexuosa]TQM76683.1 chorismate mutase [Thermopolyspora flexuosa]
MSEAASGPATPPRRHADGAESDTPTSLAEIRAAIDAIDAELTVLLARRQRLVKAAASFKADERAVRAPGRVEEVLAAARRRALEHGLATEVAEAVWSAMVGAFIDLELREHRAAERRASG